VHIPTGKTLSDREIAELLISLSRKLLYVLLFVILLFARWDMPFSFGFVGSIVIFVFLGLYYLKDEFWDDEEGEIAESNGASPPHASLNKQEL
jgi:hypothetical protein